MLNTHEINDLGSLSVWLWINIFSPLSNAVGHQSHLKNQILLIFQIRSIKCADFIFLLLWEM